MAEMQAGVPSRTMSESAHPKGIFPHPLTPRLEQSMAEEAFFREAFRRLADLIDLAIDKPRLDIIDFRPPQVSGVGGGDGVDVESDYAYQLVLLWGATKRKRRVTGFGLTPGEALTDLLGKFDG